MKVVYTALFLNDSLPGKLAKQVEDQHVTLCFKPTEAQCQLDMLGIEFDVAIIGYANDGRNEGYQVVINSDKIRSYQNVPLHITLSVAEGAKPVDTGKLVFEACQSFTVKARYGYFDGKQIVLKGL